MKILLTLIATLFTLTAKTQTNIYHPFPDSNAVWNGSTYQIWGCSQFVDFEETFSYSISDDTIIGVNQYQKLVIPAVVSNCNNFYMHYPGYAGAMRQDTSMRKVFFIRPGSITEDLLYDFNLQIADTITGLLVNNIMCLYPVTITGVDSVLINGNYRKRWQTSSYAQLIEGIGSTAGLLEHICEIIDGPILELNCFKQNGIPMYPNSTTQCDIVDEIVNLPEGNIFISVSPNPFHSSSLLNVSSEFEQSKLRIYSAMGTLVREDKLSNQKTFVLNLNDLNNGSYFIQLINEKGQIEVKKIIME